MASSPIPPAGEIVDVLLWIVFPAAVPALTLPVLLARRWGAKGRDTGLLLGAGLGLALANLLRGTLPWAPGVWGWSWLFYAWVVVVLASAAAVWLGPRRYLREFCTLTAAAISSWVVLPESYRALAWAFPLLTAIAWVPWICTPAAECKSPASPRFQIPDVLVLLTFALLGGSVVLIHAHSARLMDVALIAACALGGATVAGALGSDGWVLWGIPCITLPGLMLAGWHSTSSEVQVWSFALIGLSAWPLIAFRNRSPHWKIRIWRGLLVVLPVLVAVVLALRAETLEF